MSYQAHREEFIARIALAMSANGAGAYYASSVARKLMRHASTLQRLAVAQCNGDWPADNGERKTAECPLCNSYWAPSVIMGGKLAYAATAEVLGHGAYGIGEITKQGITPRACPDCRTTAAITAIVRAELPMYQAIVNGDPRGYVVTLAPREATREDISSGRAPIIYVPGRE